MKTNKERLSDFFKEKFWKLVTSKESLKIVMDAFVRVALGKKLLTEVEIRLMLIDSIAKYNKAIDEHEELHRIYALKYATDNKVLINKRGI